MQVNASVLSVLVIFTLLMMQLGVDGFVRS